MPNLGDSRPDPSLADDSPMEYRRGTREGYLDRADREEVLPKDYVPAPRPEPRGHVAPARAAAEALQRAENQFRRVKGHRALPTLINALEESTRARRSGIERGGV